MTRWFLILTFLLLLKLVAGQQLDFIYVGDKLGLPVQECYNVMQDSKGYMWISTEAGLCKYNGVNSIVFNKANGLEENACYVVAEDKYETIWLVTSSNRVLRIKKDSIEEAPFSKHYISQLKGGLKQSYCMYFKNDSIIINSHEGTYIVGMNASSGRSVEPASNSDHCFINTNGPLACIKSDNRGGINKVAASGTINLLVSTGKQATRFSIPHSKTEGLYWRVLTATNSKGEYFICIGTKLIKLDIQLNYEVIELPYVILSLYCDKADGLWAGTAKGGVYYYENTNNLDKQVNNLNGYSVSGTCVDSENGVWCTTVEKGVYFCRSKFVLNYKNDPSLNKPAELLKQESGKLFISAVNNELIEMEAGKKTTHLLQLKEGMVSNDIIRYRQGWIVSSKNFMINTNTNFGDLSYVKLKKRGLRIGANELAYAENGKVFAINYGEILELTDHTAAEIAGSLTAPGRCLISNGNHLFYGCKDGMFRMFLSETNGYRKYQTQKIPGIEGGVSKIFRNSKKEIWIISKESGVYMLVNDSALNITKKLNIPSERIYDITEDRFGTYWFGSNIGLIKISAKGHTSVYNSLNGLTSNDVYKVAADSDFIYMSTIDGINRFPIQQDLSNTNPPRLYVKSIQVNGENRKLESDLTYNENSIKLELDVLTFKETNRPKFYYELTEQQNSYTKKEIVEGSMFDLDNLMPGMYELKLYAINNDGLKSREPIYLHFNIQKPFWQTLWFIAGCILAGGVIIVLIVRKIINLVKKREEEKTAINKQLAEYQLTALQAQMNPHFIFNAINSVQRYILERSKHEAYEYLAKFGKLIRIVLNNSEEKVLPLQKELEMLRLYIELEQLRFSSNFEFKIAIEDGLNPYDLNVPAMLIQPYIENAIWHGLMNLENKRKGTLSIDVRMNGDLLKITIEDNGIGRKKALEYKQESVHRPVAMKLTEKRLMMINQMQNYESAKVIISDLHDEEGMASGTRVEIFIPV